VGNLLQQIKFDDKGLVGAIVQDDETHEVLMFAWMNREALELTLRERRAWYWSRSRGRFWLKGETSGHVQEVHEIRLDCDGDALVIKVKQTGGACHTGFRSCFFRKEDGGEWIEDGDKVFDSKKVY
jgi:phosphoribosyl-AMP cyclohydrolase